jgi:hypothetical protein
MAMTSVAVQAPSFPPLPPAKSGEILINERANNNQVTEVCNKVTYQ